MNNSEVGSGGPIEKAIWFIAGNFMALGGVGMAYLCYQWATDSLHDEYRYIWIAGAATLSFLLLRGAWFTIFPAKPEPARFTTRDR